MRSARVATFVYFGLNGFVLGMWIVHIPVIEQRVGVSHALLGWLLLLLGLGAFLGMRLVGPIADRFGVRRVVPVTGVVCSAALVLPALAMNAWTLGIALLVFGLGNGGLDVSMNTHAVQVEARYQRPIMAAFHAVFSVGGVLASLVGARTLSWGWSALTTLTTVSVIGLVAAIAVAPALLPGPRTSVATGTAGPKRPTPLRIWVLAGLALVLMLSEGVANDWSALATRDVLGASAATAAFAYGAFAAAMTIGRFLADAVTARVGSVVVLRYGSALAALALAVVALAPSVPLALVGWALFGIGLSGSVPLLFSAAGHTDPESAGTNVSRVAGLGYLGMLAGPAVIGPLTHVVALNHTFFLPMGLCVIAAIAAGVLRPKRPADTADHATVSGPA
jgi:MFS family permease